MDILIELEKRYNTEVLCAEFCRLFKMREKYRLEPLKIIMKPSQSVYEDAGDLGGLDEVDENRFRFYIQSHHNIQTLGNTEAFDKLLDKAKNPYNTHFETELRTPTLLSNESLMTVTWISERSRTDPLVDENYATYNNTWFSTCVEELTTPKEGPEYSLSSLDAKFVTQGLTLARALLQMGHARIAPLAKRYNPKDIWHNMKHDGYLCRDTGKK